MFANDRPSAEILLAAIIESSDDAIISKSLMGIVTSWNSGAQRIFGYNEEEMIGNPIAMLIPPERAEEEPEILRRLQLGERVDHFETVRVRKDGREIHVSVTISPIRNNDGVIIGASKVARDITEQKEAQRQLALMMEEVKRNDRMKGEFVATLSHELRTPLNAIVGWLEILKSDHLEKAELEEGLAAIERNTRSQVQMIEDLLDMSRIETGKIVLDLQALDVAAVCTAAISSIQPMLQAKDLRLTTAFDSVNGVVMGDRNRLQQIIWNLLTNAAKFTPKGGRIHITLERVNSHLELAVRDNGMGIPNELLPLIFERFRQGDASSTRHQGGLGLGLSISKHLVELHGGHLNARSGGRDQGATFIISLPVAAAHYDERKSTAAHRNAMLDAGMEKGDLFGYRILAVDDEEDSLTVLKKILMRHHAVVHAAASVDEALACLETFKPDLLLTDIGMPGRDGYDLLREMRNLKDGASIPAIALTALLRQEDRIRSLRSGFQMHLGKPVNTEELVAAIQNLMSLKGER